VSARSSFTKARGRVGQSPVIKSPVIKFAIVGALGFLLQLLTLRLLIVLAHWSWPLATIAAVEGAVVHNFLWHERWTWVSRLGRPTWRDRAERFVRFNVTNGIASVAGNVAVMAVLVDGAHLPPVVANAIAVVVVSLLNFVFADRWVFRPSPASCRFVAVVFALLTTAARAAAAPNAATLDAWAKYVAATESRLRQPCPATASPVTGIVVDGETIDIGAGTISDWRGSVFLPAITVDELLRRLQHPGTPPPQEDVVSSRVLARGPDFLRVYIRLVRRAIVTVTYDTEHEMTFTRVTPSLATARSVATRIEESDGGDHGFLWRLNSYWQYEQVGSGVLVRVESLSLSRDVPLLIKPIAGRIVPRIARESMIRTLEALARFSR
jgi:putative flippase GtrA